MHVDDVARAIGGATESEAPSQDVFFVGHSQHCSEQDIGQVLARLFNRPYRPVRVPRPLLWMWALGGELGGVLGVPGPMTFSRLRELSAGGFVCSVEKADARLGFRATIGLDAGFETTARWYRDHGWLSG